MPEFPSAPTSDSHAIGPRTMRAQAVADRYGLSLARVYELCRTGLIPHIRIGRQIRFDPVRLAEWESAGGSAHSGGWRQEGA